MQIKSTSFINNQPIPATYTADGENINPPLSFSDVPAQAKSLAIIMHDPDAVGGDFTHWLVWNIEPKDVDLPAGCLPMGAIEGRNSAGQSNYHGPKPPAGTGMHHYIFELYALDTELQELPSSDENALRLAIGPHIIDQATLTGLFSA